MQKPSINFDTPETPAKMGTKVSLVKRTGQEPQQIAETAKKRNSSKFSRKESSPATMHLSKPSKEAIENVNDMSLSFNNGVNKNLFNLPSKEKDSRNPGLRSKMSSARFKMKRKSSPILRSNSKGGFVNNLSPHQVNLSSVSAHFNDAEQVELKDQKKVSNGFLSIRSSLKNNDNDKDKGNINDK